MKTVKMFGRTVPIVAILLISILSIGAFGALLKQYATVEMTANMEQSVLLDGGTSVTDTLEGFAGRTYCYYHTLENLGHKDAPIYFTWTCDKNKDGITVSYLKPLNYKTAVRPSGTIVADIVVKDVGDAIRWTIDIDMDASPVKNGHTAYGLVISKDHIHPAFQIHNNDGTDALYPWGTHLYSKWVEGEGYNGWLTGWNGEGERTANNIPVDDIDWITCTGERDNSLNHDGIYTIEIKKCYLGDTFYWAIQLMGDTCDTHYPEKWVMWSGDASTFAEAKIAKDISSYTLGMLETLDFYIVYDFGIALEPNTYAITTIVNVGTPPQN